MSADSIPDTLEDGANVHGRSLRHVLLGAAITLGAVGLSALIARRSAGASGLTEAEADELGLRPHGFRPRRAVFGLVWPPLFLALTLSGLRVWNAPRSPARTQALTLWGMVQALNAIWMALGPKRLGGQLAATVASLGTSAAYAYKAHQVDAPAANPLYLGWISFANVVTEELWRKSTAPPTIH